MIIAGVAVVADVWLALWVAPEAAGFHAPLTQRIFYFHVPAAWVAYLAFLVTSASCVMLLWRRDERWDAIAASSAEIGLVLAVVALVTGLIWAGQEFIGYSPLEDPKLITLAVLILSYLAYFTLRGSVAEREKRARLSAVFGILSFIGVPLSFLASRASVHPDFTRSDSSLDWALGKYLLFSTLVFTLVYAALLQARLTLWRLEAALGERDVA